jgi:hypothetical protein
MKKDVIRSKAREIIVLNAQRVLGSQYLLGKLLQLIRTCLAIND